MMSFAYRSNGMHANVPRIERVMQNRFANRGEITPPCGVPAMRGTTLPSSICTGRLQPALDVEQCPRVAGGNAHAMALLAEHLDGKVPQQLQVRMRKLRRAR